MAQVEEAAYKTAVARLANLLRERKDLENGGKAHTGWMDANFAVWKAVREASARFKGHDFDIMDDAYMVMTGAKDIKDVTL